MSHITYGVGIPGILGITALSIILSFCPNMGDANQSKRQKGAPFLSVFPLTGLGAEWWVAGYDHPASWFDTSWREDRISIKPSGIRIDLSPTPEDKRVTQAEIDADDGTLADAGMTSKTYTSGQVQRRKWYGYGRYEIVMRPAVGDGLISAFYVYTGPYFGDSHEEIDIEFLGRDTSKIYLNRFIDGKPLEKPVWADLGFDASEKSRLYAFEWRKDSIVWYAEGQEIFRVEGADQVPKPPAKIYFDLWAGGPQQEDWAGEADIDSTARALVQCVSFSPLNAETIQCGEIMERE